MWLIRVTPVYDLACDGTKPLPDDFANRPRAREPPIQRRWLAPVTAYATTKSRRVRCKSRLQRWNHPSGSSICGREIDDKTFGKGFDCFTDDAVCNIGVADWKGREAICAILKAFIDTGFTARHRVTEYWDAGFLKAFRGVVDMTPDDRSRPTVHPTMSHFFYMDEKDQSKVRWWVGAVGPVSFS